jgi:hypothetical protein
VRSHNGGPIDVSLAKARGIQFRKIKIAVAVESDRRAADIELFDKPIEPNWSVLRDAVRRADAVAKLRRVWPIELMPPPSSINPYAR